MLYVVLYLFFPSGICWVVIDDVMQYIFVLGDGETY